MDETEKISELKPNKSKTVWVGITRDCSINVNYLENGIKKNGIVAGGMAQKMKHKIGSENHLEF